MRLDVIRSSSLAVVIPIAFAACKLQSRQAGQSSSNKSAPGTAATPSSSSGILGVQAAWVELAGGSSAIVRVVTTATNCPNLTVDSTTQVMKVRTAPSKSYPVTVCDAQIPPNAKSAALGSQVLNLPKANPQRILIIGDTGCRMKADKGVLQLQNCNSAADWPFAQVANSVAKAHADLIIHVGDYHYREDPCPVGNQECAGAITGDVWGSWSQDFFSPGLPLLESAPMLFVRGNHEECARAGMGWFTFLDPRAMPPACSDQTQPYWVTVGDHQVAVIDSADDKNMQPSFNMLQPVSGAFVWWILHRPFLTAGADDELTGAPSQLPGPWQAAGVLSSVITGHQHRLAYNQFPSKTWPPEMINGNGGTYLDNETVKGQPFGVINNASYVGVEWFDYGFATLDRQDGGWALVARDSGGNPAIQCVLTEAIGTQSKLNCTPTAAANTPPPARPSEKVPSASSGVGPVTSSGQPGSENLTTPASTPTKAPKVK